MLIKRIYILYAQAICLIKINLLAVENVKKFIFEQQRICLDWKEIDDAK